MSAASAGEASGWRAIVLGAPYARRSASAAVFFFGLGLLWHLLPFTTNLVRPLTPFMLLAFGGVTLLPLVAAEGGRMAAWIAASYAAGFALEALGVATGVVFGPYEYGTALGARVLGVPPIIGFNWVVVIAACAEMAWLAADRIATSSRTSRRSARIMVASILAGILAALFDWVMEPAAIALGYWTWLVPEIPLLNYFTWFAFTAVSAAAFFLLKRERHSRSPALAVYLLVQLLFFAGIRLATAAGVVL
jgi:putative membrane protein